MHITGLEANFLLWCLDNFCNTNSKGEVQLLYAHTEGYTLEQVQDLRDRLMAAHEHPKEKVFGSSHPDED